MIALNYPKTILKKKTSVRNGLAVVCFVNLVRTNFIANQTIKTVKRFISIFVFLFCVLIVSGQSVKFGFIEQPVGDSSKKTLTLTERKIGQVATFEDTIVKSGFVDEHKASTNKIGYYVLVLFVFAVLLLVVEECVVFFVSNKE